MTTFPRCVRRLLALFVLVCGGLVSAWANADAIIAKARAYHGPDATLDAIKSIHYFGKLLVPESAAKDAKMVEVPVEILFQKPYRQRIMATFPNRTETTVLDGYDAWVYIKETWPTGRWRTDFMDKDQTKRLRANTWENLAFYRGLERRGGQVEDLGDVTVGGVACRKVAFRHESSIVFFRYFDKATGRLVLTETEQGSSIREEGEIIVNGVRLSKKNITTTRLPDGSQRVVSVTFDKITLNEAVPESLFAAPLPR